MFDKKPQFDVHDRITQLHNLSIVIKNALDNWNRIICMGEANVDQETKNQLKGSIMQLIGSYEQLSNRLWAQI